MTNSATSTKASRSESGTGFQTWHFFTLLSMIGATVVVMVSHDTHPAALLLLSAAVVGAGLVGLAISRAIAGFYSGDTLAAPLPAHSRDELQREKALVLRSIKELEFDQAMGKVSEADFTLIAGRLRARALSLMQELERQPAAPPPKKPAPAKTDDRLCRTCGTANDPDARFCKSCGAKLGGKK
jgi:hypothetical protein